MAEQAHSLPRLVIAGAHSGAGKTTLTAGLIAAWRRCGLAVQPFKVGPDYIDPSYHTLAAGRPCRNLDSWMLPPDAMRSSFGRGCRGADLAVVEGVMGLFDGFSYDDEAGSTAQVAKLIGAPVVLVLSIRSLARSTAALAQGYARFDPHLGIAGFILNDAASPSHGEGVAKAVTGATELPCFGWLPHDERLNIPERHLGLVPTAEPGRWEAFIAAAADHVARYLDLHALLAAAQDVVRTPQLGHTRHPERSTFLQEGAQSKDASCAQAQDRRDPALAAASAEGKPDTSRTDLPSNSRCRIAVAHDEAFSFYYEDNLDLLREAGAELAFFSPLTDKALPARCHGLYLGGGFPEVYAARLADNAGLRAELCSAIGAGLPTYAECGGLMYLTRFIDDLEGRTYPMVGALPGRSVMAGRLTLGYREVITERATLLAAAGTTLRGHEFHYSEWVESPDGTPAAYRVAKGGAPDRREGYACGNLLASYVHLHWGATPELAARFVGACREEEPHA